MALNVNAALLKLDPLKPLGFDLPDKKQASMERERLKLAREQFEEVKRQNVQDAEYRRISEAGEMTRAQMQTDRERERLAAQAQAETVAQRRAAYDSMVKRLDTGDYEGMEADATRLNALGGLAERVGQDDHGFPAWRLELDAEQARKQETEEDRQTAPRGPNETAPESLGRLNALGYDTLGLRDAQAETTPGAATPLSTEDAFHAAQRAARGPDEAPPAAPEAPPEDTGVSAYDYAGEADAAKDYAEPGRSTPMAPPPGLEPSIFQATGRPARAAAAPDAMGSVPKNVIDTGAMQMQRNQRLGPVMDNMVRGMPQAYQAGTRANADAALGMGLPADKAVDQALKLNAPANAALANERQMDFEKEKAEKAATPKPLNRVQIQRLAEGGEKSAKEVYDNLGIADTYTRSAAAQNMIGILSDDDQNNDQAIAFELPNMLGSKGAQSNKDLAVALGLDAMSTVDMIKERLHNIIAGGYTDMRKESLIAIIQNRMDKDDELVYQFLDGIDEGAARAADDDVRRGLLDYAAKNVPEAYRTAHENEKRQRGAAPKTGANAAPAPGATQGAGAATMEPGENPIPKSSRIAYEHNNPGNLIFDKDNPAGGEPGEDKEGGGKWARFPTVEAGFDALRQYIQRNEDMTLSAFFNKYAPKKDKNDTEKYIADAARALKLSPDDTIYEADAYDVMRFIAQRESSTPMPDIYAKRRAKAEALDARDGPNPDLSRDTPTTDGATAAATPTDADLLEGME